MNDTELESWRSAFPGIVSRRVSGDPEVAALFNGEARSLLWEVKNALKLGSLDQLSRSRRYPDGTVIRVVSAFGTDSISIDTTNSIYAGDNCKCEIEIIDAPLVVPPMCHPMHIHTKGDDIPEGFSYGWCGKWADSEKDGVNYFKVHYRVKASGCSNAELVWSACGTGDFEVGPGKSNAECSGDFLYKTPIEPYFGGLDYSEALEAQGFVDIPPDPNNHCVWSFSGCHAEIVGLGADRRTGQYILLKAYTEWSYANPYAITYSRTGLGYLKLKAWLRDKKTLKELCSDEKIIKVDCCEKPEDERIVNIYWAFLSGWPWNCMNQPSFVFGTSQWCEVPDKLDFWYMARIATWYGFNITTLPELKGSCLPFDWTLQGPGKITPWGTGREWCAWELPKSFSYAHPSREDACRDVVITGKDRCGNEKKIVGSCCKYGGGHEINILYTSIWMDFLDTQLLIASYGCPPFTWTTTNGSFIGSTDGNTVIFQAPDSNVDCQHHPLVTVTDCCGVTATIQLYASNYDYGGMALQLSDAVDGGCLSPPYDYGTTCYWQCYWNGVAPFGPCHTVTYFENKSFGCDGEMLSDCVTGGVYVECNSGCGPGRSGNCWTAECGGHAPAANCGTLYDERTAAAKAAGCCPMNPFTGLPYA
jgi:hypothetical protein